MDNKLKDIYQFVPQGYFKDEAEFQKFASDPKNTKDLFLFIQEGTPGAFKTEADLSSFLSLKKKEPTQLGSGNGESVSPSKSNKPKVVDTTDEAPVEPKSFAERFSVGLAKNRPINLSESTSVKPTTLGKVGEKPSVKPISEEKIPVKAKTLQSAPAQTEMFNQESWDEVLDKVKGSAALTPQDYFNNRAELYAQINLDEDQQKEFALIKNIENTDNEIARLTKLSKLHENPDILLNLSKAQAAKANQEAAYTKYKADKYNQIDSQIKEYQDIINSNTQQDVKDYYNFKIKELNSQKENFFLDQDQKVVAEYNKNKQDINKFNVPGSTPKEKLQNYYLLLQGKEEKLWKQLNPSDNPNINALRGSLYGLPRVISELVPGVDTEVFNQWQDINKTIKAISPAVLINRNPIKDIDEGFVESFGKSLAKTLVPSTELYISTPSELANKIKQSIAIAGIPENAISPEAGKILSDKIKGPESFSSEWWGNIVGTSVGMIPYFAAGTELVKGASMLGRLPVYTRYLKGTKYGKYLVAEPVMTGLGYKTAGYLMPATSDVLDEATFLSGYLGGIAQVGIEKVLNTKYIASMFNKLFGDDAERMAMMVSTVGERTGKGFGEYGQEIGEAVGQMVDSYKKSGDFNKLKQDFNENFGTMSKNLELFVASFTMGAIMGAGTGPGQASIAKSKDFYNNLSAEDKKKADSFVKRVTQERYNAMVAAKKAEMKETGAKVEPVTEKDIKDKNDAIDVLSSQESSPQERQAALSVLADVNLKIDANKIAKTAESELKAGDTSVEVKPEDTVLETKAEPIVTQSVYDEFVNTGNVPEATLTDIATKVKNREALTEEENAIFAGKTSEINDIISKDFAEVPEPKPLTNGTQVQMEPQIKGGMPRIMEFKDGIWFQKVGNELANVSQGVQQEAQDLYDSQNKARVSGEVGVGQEPIQTKPIQGAGQEAPSTSGDVQASEKVKESGEFVVQGTFNGHQVIAGNKAYEVADYRQIGQKGNTELVENTKGDKKIYTLVTPNTDAFNRRGYMGVSLVLPNTTTKTKAEIQSILEAKTAEVKANLSKERPGSFNKAVDMKYEGITEVPVTQKAEVKPPSIPTIPKVEVKPSSIPVTQKEETTAQTPQEVDETKAGTVELRSMELANKNVEKFLKDSGISVNVMDTQSEYDAAQKNEGLSSERGSEGFFIAKNSKIYINKSNLDKNWAKTILYHEATHPVINIIRNTNPEKYKALVNGIKDLASNGNKEIKEGINDALNWTKQQYAGSPEGTIEDEGVVEVIARIASGRIKFGQIEPTLREKIVEFINQIAKAIGLPPITPKTDTETFKKTARQVADAMRRGKSISKVVGKENVKKYQFDTISNLGGQLSITRFGKTGIKKVPVLDIEEYKRRIENGTLKVSSPQEALGDNTFMLTFPDDLFVGDVFVGDVKVADFGGGVIYVVVDGESGRMWASVNERTAKAFADNVNKSLEINKGTAMVVLVKGTDTKHASSMSAKVGFMKALLRYAEKNESMADGLLTAIKEIYSIGNVTKPETAINRFNNYLEGGRGEDGQTMKEAKSAYDGLRASLVKYANPLITKMALEMGYGDGYFNATKLKGKNPSYEASNATVDKMFADILQEDFLKGVPDGQAYAVIKATSKVVIKHDLSHPSYPWVIQTEDGSPVTLELFDKTFMTYGENEAITGRYDKPTQVPSGRWGVVSYTVPKFKLNPNKKLSGPGTTDLLGALNKYKTISEAETKAKAQKSVGGREKINWTRSKEGKGDPAISSRNPMVQKAVQDLKEGKISNEEYRAIASENSPIRPITTFFEPATDAQIEEALKSDQKYNANAPVRDGERVGLRLDIPAYKNNNTWVVSVHDGENDSKNGKIISYRNVARITNAKFSEEALGAFNIAAGKEKATIARIFGDWSELDGSNSQEKADAAKLAVEEIVNDPNWVQVGMNPFRHSYFYDRSNDIGRPVKSADEVIQIGGLVYAKNVVYGNWTDEAYKVKEGLLDSKGAPVQFSKGGREVMNVNGTQQKVKDLPEGLSIVDGFYSPIEKRILEFKQPKASATKWKEIVGAKSDEAVFSGLAGWLESKRPDEQVTKEEIQQFIKDNRIEIKEVIKPLEQGARYAGYVVEGDKSDYKETLITLSNKAKDKLVAQIADIDKRLDDISNELSETRTYKKVGNTGTISDFKLTITNPKEFERLSQEKQQLEEQRKSNFQEVQRLKENEFYYKKHYDEADILVHTRSDIRKDDKGNKTFFIEEIQSDWGQQGKKEGFDAIKKYNAAKTFYYSIYKERLMGYISKDQAIEKSNQLTKETGFTQAELVDEMNKWGDFTAKPTNISTAPYVQKTNAWVKLGLKTALKQAVEAGASSVSWTTGQQQSKRYDLRKNADRISYKLNDDGTYNVNASKNGVSVGSQNNVNPKELEAFFGKDIAQRIINGEGGNSLARDMQKDLTGEQLAFGGSGMLAFYGDGKKPGIIGDAAKALVKELTGKEGEIKEVKIFASDRSLKYAIYDANGRTIEEVDNEDTAKKIAEKNTRAVGYRDQSTTAQAAIEITPELKEAVEKGMAQFSLGGRDVSVNKKNIPENPSFDSIIEFNTEGGMLEIGKVKGSKLYSILDLKVDESKRNQGIATKLLKKALDETKGQLSGMASNDKAVGLNYKLGMRAFDANGKELTLEESKKARENALSEYVKMQLPEFAMGENYTETPKETEEVIAKATDLFYKIKNTEGAAKRKALADERKALMDQNPSVKYIDDNIKTILDQLEKKEMATRKGNCP